jgi:hypothetical protein
MQCEDVLRGTTNYLAQGHSSRGEVSSGNAYTCREGSREERSAREKGLWAIGYGLRAMGYLLRAKEPKSKHMAVSAFRYSLEIGSVRRVHLVLHQTWMLMHDGDCGAVGAVRHN